MFEALPCGNLKFILETRKCFFRQFFNDIKVKRFCEPRRQRRPWLIWFYDTSKQGMGALVIHFANIFLAEFFQGDPCTWYIVSFLLDSSAGLLIIFIGIRLTQHVSRKRGWDHLVFGEYGKPPYVNAWLSQCAVYIALMLIEKILITLLIQLDFWDQVRKIIMSPIKDPKVEVAIVVLIVPFIINVFMFWVVDNFLMQKHGRWKQCVVNGKVKIQYERSDQESCSESEILLSGEDDPLAVEVTCQQRHPMLIPVS
ncbi:store-operated calcium entry regulator STIMATE-like isoform X2 [Stegodyphus dumicola]|uniref:store-operated calcium entry regulator STIMATE-like isoform X2 n=1 Tax=Stegodyphus dumicola TaxID=202533 RepID=UPI0015AED0E8|nr:store-operated calcium entry regulator STIMATE-like isoform X2 [Stegodyphus dumicola]